MSQVEDDINYKNKELAKLIAKFSLEIHKGDKRPIFNEKERLDILTSLEFVDYIVVFDEETPINLINDIKPDILIKGANYKDKFIVGKKEECQKHNINIFIDDKIKHVKKVSEVGIKSLLFDNVYNKDCPIKRIYSFKELLDILI